MGIKENAEILKGKLQARIDELQADQSLIDQMVADSELAVSEARLAGIEEGKGMIQLPDSSNPDAIYSQAQLAEAVVAGQVSTLR